MKKTTRHTNKDQFRRTNQNADQIEQKIEQHEIMEENKTQNY